MIARYRVSWLIMFLDTMIPCDVGLFFEYKKENSMIAAEFTISTISDIEDLRKMLHEYAAGSFEHVNVKHYITADHALFLGIDFVLGHYTLVKRMGSLEHDAYNKTGFLIDYALDAFSREFRKGE